MPVTLVKSSWSSGSLVFHESTSVAPSVTYDVLTIGASAVKIGNTSNDVDFQFYGTSSISAIIDCGLATLTLVGITATTNKPLTISDTTAATSSTTGALIVSGGLGLAGAFWTAGNIYTGSGAIINFNSGDVTLTHSSNLLTLVGGGLTLGATGVPAGDFILWATQAGAKIWLDVDGDTNGAFYFGADDTGIDVAFYGQTASNSMTWDASANALVFVAAGITMGVASKFVLPVKASGSTTLGDIWYDTTDGALHFYATGGEYTISYS